MTRVRQQVLPGRSPITNGHAIADGHTTARKLYRQRGNNALNISFDTMCDLTQCPNNEPSSNQQQPKLQLGSVHKLLTRCASSPEPDPPARVAFVLSPLSTHAPRIFSTPRRTTRLTDRPTACVAREAPLSFYLQSQPTDQSINRSTRCCGGPSPH